MYADKGRATPQGKTTDDTALFEYEGLDLVTSKGQSGSALQVMTDEDKPRIAGVHVGSKGNKGYATMITKSLWYDYVLPVI